MPSILQTKYYNLGKGISEKYLVQTQSWAKTSDIKIPEVHGIGKGLDPNAQPEKQVFKANNTHKMKEVSQMRPRLGQGRAGLRCKMKSFQYPLH